MDKKILTRKGEVILVDEDDYDLLSGYTWYINNCGYAVSSQRDKETRRGYHIKMHRFLTNPPDDMYVDHINGNTLDNRKCNLRIVTPKQNTYNTKKKKNTTSIYKGVTFNRESGMWRGAIRVDGKYINIGLFTNETACGLAYNDYANKYFGEYAKLNNIDSDINWMDYLHKRKQSSNVKGVYLHKQTGKWIGRVTVNGKRIHLGTFETEEEAIIAVRERKRNLEKLSKVV